MKGGQTSKDGNIKVMQVSFEAPWRVNNLFFFFCPQDWRNSCDVFIGQEDENDHRVFKNI